MCDTRIARGVVLLALCWAFLSPAAGADSETTGWYRSSEDRPYWRKNLFKRVLSDQAYLVTKWWPAEIRNPYFTGPLVVSVGMALSSEPGEPGVDDRAELWVGKYLRGEARTASTAFSRLGDGETAAVLIGGAYLFSRLAADVQLSATCSLTAEALIDAAIWNVALKAITSRSRPSHGPSSQLFDSGTTTYSFPSGHAMGAFAVATVVAGQYRHRKWVPWVAYGTAGLIAASRVSLGRHYVSDVIAGSVLGRSIGRMVLSRARGVERSRSVSWTPIVDPATDGYGVLVTISW